MQVPLVAGGGTSRAAAARRLPDGQQRPAMRRAVTAEEGRLQPDVLVLVLGRGPPARGSCPRWAGASSPRTHRTLVVGSVQAGRRTPDSLLTRR